MIKYNNHNKGMFRIRQGC